MNREKLSLYHTAFDCGLYEGEVKGKIEGIELSLRKFITTYKKKGMSKRAACEIAKASFELSKDEITFIIDEIYN